LQILIIRHGLAGLPLKTATRTGHEAESDLLPMFVWIAHHLDGFLAVHRRDHKAIVECA